jgi:translocation and assembly module TamA
VAAAIEAWRQEGNAKARGGLGGHRRVHPADRLDGAVGLATGPELSFGPVQVTGNEDVRTARILRIASIPTGSVFSPEDLERAATRLRRTGTFDSVALIESEALGPGNTLPIELQVVESLPRRVGFGAEISSVDGLSVNAFWLHRNLLGGAERLRFDAEVSDIGGEQLAPIRGARIMRWGSASRARDLLARQRPRGGGKAVAGGRGDYFLSSSPSMCITRYVGDDLVLTGALGVLAAREETALGVRDYALLTLPLTATLDRRDDPQDARRGFYLAVEATPFLSLTDEGGNGGRLYADGRVFRSFGERFRLAARGQIGSVFGAERDEVPQEFLFFSGGGGTVRGQPFRSLGVEVPDPGNPDETLTLGGASFAGLQLEGRFDINETFGAVAFADAGYVGEDAFPETDGEFHAGVGVGVRYNSFIGPIRLDIATPATGDDAFRQVQLYVGIGQAF